MSTRTKPRLQSTTQAELEHIIISIIQQKQLSLLFIFRKDLNPNISWRIAAAASSPTKKKRVIFSSFKNVMKIQKNHDLYWRGRPERVLLLLRKPSDIISHKIYQPGHHKKNLLYVTQQFTCQNGTSWQKTLGTFVPLQRTTTSHWRGKLLYCRKYFLMPQFYKNFLNTY
jgi:hypothetical protein